MECFIDTGLETLSRLNPINLLNNCIKHLCFHYDIVKLGNIDGTPLLTSGFLRAVSRARPGPKPVSDLTLVDAGRGLLHWVKTEKARDLRCWAYRCLSSLFTG